MLFVQGVWRLLTHHISLLQVAVTCSVVAAAVTPGALVANVGEDAPSVREGFGPGDVSQGRLNEMSSLSCSFFSGCSPHLLSEQQQAADTSVL